MSRLLFATTNLGKLGELAAMLGPAHRALSLSDVPSIPTPIEDGATFEENAMKKAIAYCRATGLATLADDSGLCVDALGGRPGVHSARYAPGDDQARVRKLLGELSAVPADRRGATFRCALCLARPDGGTEVQEGECRGEIALGPRGTNGFGYDPIFLVPSLGKTLAELPIEEKGRLSHRGKAFEKMKPHLLALLAPGA